MGLIKLATDTGSILWAQAGVVREHDTFVINGYDKPPTHAHNPFAKPEQRGAITGAYVVVKTPDGEYLTHTMAIDEIHATRDRSESWKAYVKDKSKKNPWVTDETEMIKKTVVKQAQKYWPKTDRTERVDEAVHLLNTDGEGFDKAKPSTLTYPEAMLQDWIEKAEATATQDALTAIWKMGVADINTYKDLTAYDKFKTAVVAHGTTRDRARQGQRQGEAPRRQRRRRRPPAGGGDGDGPRSAREAGIAPCPRSMSRSTAASTAWPARRGRSPT